MDRFDAMRAFVRIVERRSFTLAAQDIGLPRSTITQTIKQLEARLGVRLLQRTTRTVSPTLDGEAYYRRCIAIIDDVEDAEGAFGGTRPKGMLRIEVQGTLARHFLMPGLPDFFAQYPDVEITMTERDRYVDIVREGADCVLRFGALPDSDMVARRIGTLQRMTCAAPDYIGRLGSPADIDALSGHRMVGLRRLTTGALDPLQFTVADRVHSVVLAAPMSVSGPESYITAARLGLGLVQMPDFHAVGDLARGTLVRVLPEFPPPSVPVSLLYPPNRQLSPRVRIFLDWAAGEFGKRNAPA
ncbi:MAG TPA: LysR family transcriptional regulator [Acetobacteraceae bacterium]|nr:LysR family transcriptional regulator [Acetobacteraceae bacterium]